MLAWRETAGACTCAAASFSESWTPFSSSPIRSPFSSADSWRSVRTSGFISLLECWAACSCVACWDSPISRTSTHCGTSSLFSSLRVRTKRLVGQAWLGSWETGFQRESMPPRTLSALLGGNPAVIPALLSPLVRRRGLVMGIWNSNLNVGNILGAIIPATVLSINWGWSFLVPSLIMLLVAFFVFTCIAVHPNDVGLPDLAEPQHPSATASRADQRHSMPVFTSEDELTGAEARTPLLASQTANHRPITIWQSLFIPGVVPFAIALFFTKLISYTFLDWLPYYVKYTPINGEYLSDADSAYFSTLFDVGGILGGILAGYFADRFHTPAITCVTMLYISVAALYLYRQYGGESIHASVGLLLFAGAFVNGPYALITTAVSADLGSHHSLRGNAKALSVVSGVIDGTGSLGATLGPFIAGIVPGWSDLFYILMASAAIAAVCLTLLVVKEVKALWHTGSGNYEFLVES
eukprot:m.553280 g.553280  ORF g.553280 m.553280 type:complete len:467 (-) comp57742_c0_seq32:144-1544(-)